MKKNTQFLCNEKPNLGKILQKTKTSIFPKSVSTRLLKAECFIEIAKGLEISRVVADFKRSANKGASTFRVFIRGLFKGAGTHKTFSVTS